MMGRINEKKQYVLRFHYYQLILKYYYNHNKTYPKKLQGDIQNDMFHIENFI